MEEQLCNTPLDEWIDDIRTHLKSVIQSGLVGLFDTPYPYLAPQVLELANKLRKVPPIIAMTERDPKSWAMSRSKHHGILVCQKEYSYEKLGASEFDVIGCYHRAKKYAAQSKNHSEVLRFWDVFQYRSLHEEIDNTFQDGMELQMRHHQEEYLPITQYAPDFFNMHSSENNNGLQQQFKEEDVAIDIRQYILGNNQIIDGGGNNIISRNSSPEKKLQSIWKEVYTKPLTCRGRVNWNIENDTLIELYHLPKTCGEISSKKSRKEKNIPSAYAHNDILPLIPIKI